MQVAPAALNEAVEKWFASHGLVVHKTHYQFAYEFYGWRYYGEKKVFTLWISEITAEDYDPNTILFVLKEIDPLGLMDEYRHVHAHVASNETEFGVHVRSEFTPSAA